MAAKTTNVFAEERNEGRVEVNPGPSQLIAILCDPVSYYRPWRRSRDAMHPSHRAGLNEFLIRHYALPAWSASPGKDRLLAAKIADVWSRLQSVAYLLACGKNSRWISAHRAAVSLPPPAHHFARMGFRDEESLQAPSDLDDESLVSWGGCYLQLLADRLPPWMSARLPLPFVGLDSAAPAIPVALDMTCIWMAIHYASIYPDIRTRNGH